MDNTAGIVHRWQWRWAAGWDPSLALPFEEFAKVVMPIQFGTRTDFSSPKSPARKAFEDHHENVRRTVSKERLLEYRVQEGWEPLCESLGVEVPDESFPRMYDAEQFSNAHSMMWWLAFAKMVGKIGDMVAVPLTGIVAAMWYGQQTS